MTSSPDIPQVLLFAEQFSVRGQCAYTLRLAEALPQEGFGAAVICPDARAVPEERRRELPIREYPHLLRPVLRRVVQEILLRQLSLDPPELIHAQTPAAFSGAAWIAGQLERPLVLTVHDFLPPGATLRLNRKICRRIITVCDAVRDDLCQRFGIPRAMISVIPSGVECGQEKSLEPILQPGKVPVIGTAGPLEPVKGIPYFLGAAARVLAAGRDVEFVVAGAGPEERNLRRLARELGITAQVTFLSNLSDFLPALEAMDIYCLPSLKQGLGTIMLEAMSLGRPVIATNVGGLFEVIRDGETGFLVPPADSAAFASRILELLDDPVLARRLGTAGRRVVEQDFDVIRMVQETTAIYRAVLEEQSAAVS